MLERLVKLVSIPKSPLATITPQLDLQISSILSRPSRFSILEIIFTEDLFLFISFCNSVISSALLTNESAIKSTPLLIPNFISSMSLVVIEGKLILTPGKLTCLFEPILPPSITLHSKVS